MSNSTPDIFNNEINSSQNDSRGINAVAMSRINLGINGLGILTGGKNKVNMTGQNVNDIYVNNSTFNIHSGYNEFNLNSTGSFHLSGTFTQSLASEYPTIYAKNNCFKFSNINNAAIHSVFWENSNNTHVSFYLTPYSCERIIDVEVASVTDLGNGFKDTIKKAIDIESEISSNEQNMYDSLSYDLRTLEFQDASVTSKTLISQYADSANANELVLDAVTKLYSSEISLNQENNNNIVQLITFYETIILNHPDNAELITKIFYYLQKCKVILEDYSSSINGFQQIINTDPYSYEALIASWDLDATRLLDSAHGNGGGENNIELTEEVLKKKYLGDDPNDKYDTKKFSKEDRKLLRENIYKSYETTSKITVESFKNLEKKISDGEATKFEKKAYENRKVLKELAKPKNPRTIEEHLNNINNDVNKVLGIGIESIDNNKAVNLNPFEYNLSQNYPNPFNPVTNLEFQIPNSGLVSLKVYDLLGKEVANIVNENLNSGIYRYKFDGSNFASGVYFYKLTVGDFTAVKRMVLVK